MTKSQRGEKRPVPESGPRHVVDNDNTSSQLRILLRISPSLLHSQAGERTIVKTPSGLRAEFVAASEENAKSFCDNAGAKFGEGQTLSRYAK